MHLLSSCVLWHKIDGSREQQGLSFLERLECPSSSLLGAAQIFDQCIYLSSVGTGQSRFVDFVFDGASSSPCCIRLLF